MRDLNDFKGTARTASADCDMSEVQQLLFSDFGVTARYHRLRDIVVSGPYMAYRDASGRWKVPRSSLPALASALGASAPQTSAS